MQVHFWGTRGSLPAALTAAAVRSKLVRALTAAAGADLGRPEAVAAFVDALPLPVRGTYGTNTSCVELRGGREAVLCDAGTGLRDFGQHVMAALRGPDAGRYDRLHLFLSHPHWDHLQGFPFFTPAYLPRFALTIYGCHPDIEAAFAAQQDSVHFPVSLSDMKARLEFVRLAPGEPVDAAGFQVVAIEQNHPGGSYGYRFTRNGATVVYSTDAEHKEDAERADYPFLDFCRNADLLIMDAQYSLREAIDLKANWGHSSNLVAVELAVRAGARRLCLFHNEHTGDDDTLDRFLQDTRKYLPLYSEDSPLKIDLAYDGLEIEVP